MIDDPMDRIAAALERMSPAPLSAPNFDAATAFLKSAGLRGVIAEAESNCVSTLDL